MSFGGPQVDHIGNTGMFPTLSQITGLCGNALGYCHGDSDRLQGLQDRLRLASVVLREGREIEDYQTVDLGQDHLRRPGWTTRGRPEHRDGGLDAKFGTHIRLRPYRADAAVLAAIALSPEEGDPSPAGLAAALDRPARPLFLGRKACLPAEPIVFGLLDDAPDLVGALHSAPRAFPERWVTVDGHSDSAEFLAEWPVDDEGGLSRSERARTQRVVDQRVWRHQLHGGERVVMRGRLALGRPEDREGESS